MRTIFIIMTGLLMIRHLQALRKATLSLTSSNLFVKSRFYHSAPRCATPFSEGADIAGQANEMLALDFDGVICASSGESSVTAIVAAEEFWPEHVNVNRDNNDKVTKMGMGTHSEFDIIREAVSELRPIVETGYENMLLARSLLEQIRSGVPLNVPDMISKWGPLMRDGLLEKYGADKNTLIQAFGRTRDAMISRDVNGWVGLNKIYPCIMDVLSNQPRILDCEIITTKQGRFVETILQSNNIRVPPRHRIYDLDNPFGSKPNVLRHLTKQWSTKNNNNNNNNNNNKDDDDVINNIKNVPQHTDDNTSSKLPLTIHFVEDRFETLLAVSECPDLKHVKLYLADWGYNTPQQRVYARLHQRMTLLDGEGMKRLLNKFLR